MRGISKVSIDLGARRTMTRLLYPKLAQRLSTEDLHRIFGPTYKERQWAPTVARSPSSQVALLVQLKIFQAVGRFLPMKDVPAVDVSKSCPTFHFPDRPMQFPRMRVS